MSDAYSQFCESAGEGYSSYDDYLAIRRARRGIIQGGSNEDEFVRETEERFSGEQPAKESNNTKSEQATALRQADIF